MSHSDIRVVPGPANYYSHPGSLARLQDFYSEERLSRAGALLDTAKALARRLGLPVVAIPTIAATCAAWTPLSVWYNDAGQALQFEIFDDANFLVLVEPHIILNAPAEYLLAGIGDTLAKWYEAVVLAPQPETLPLTVRLGINGALAIRDVLLESSETALADQQRGELTQTFRDVVDAVIAGGGMVGGLGERYTRVAAAHANHHAGFTSRFVHQISDVTLAAMALKQQMFCPRRVKTLRQIRACALDCPLAVDPHRAGKLFRSKEIIQVRKASRMREVVRRARHDADIGVAHEVVLF